MSSLHSLFDYACIAPRYYAFSIIPSSKLGRRANCLASKPVQIHEYLEGHGDLVYHIIGLYWVYLGVI